MPIPVEPIPVEHSPVTEHDFRVMFTLFARVDGHQRDADDIDAWTLAARSGRWTRAQLAAATVALAATFRGFRVMPGHVAEQISSDREQIRSRWYCPDPPRELADQPDAELAWRRRVAADYTERALLALATHRPLDEVPLVTDPEPPVAEAVNARRRIEAICAGIADRKAIAGAPEPGMLRPTRRVRPDPDRLAAARVELDARRPAPAPDDTALAET